MNILKKRKVRKPNKKSRIQSLENSISYMGNCIDVNQGEIQLNRELIRELIELIKKFDNSLGLDNSMSFDSKRIEELSELAYTYTHLESMNRKQLYYLKELSNRIKYQNEFKKKNLKAKEG